MGLYDRVRKEKIGEQAITEAKANAMADQKAASALEALQALQPQFQPQPAMPQDMYQEPAPQPGLGLGNPEIAGQMVQQGAMNPGADIDGDGQLDAMAMQALDEIEAADAQGVPQDQLMQMFNSIPPQVQERMSAIMQSRMQEFQQPQAQQGGLAPDQQMAAMQQSQLHERDNPITEYAKQLAMGQ